MKLNREQPILVTGGAGFIGSCFVQYLNSQGFKNIVVCDHLGTSDKWKNLVGKQISDLVEKQHLFEWLVDRESRIQAIVHFGACSSTVEPDASYLVENNYRYSIMLAEWALRTDKRFIYASSAATYGDGLKGFSDEHAVLNNFRPLNMYGYSKHLFDLWLLHHGLLGQVTGLKFFNIFGPNEYHKGRMASGLCHFLPQIREKGVVRLFKSSDPSQFPDGGQCRDFLYVKDAVKMVYDLLWSDARGIYNIGSGKAETWNDLVTAMFETLALPVKIEYIDMPKDLQGKYQNYTRAEMQKVDSVVEGSRGVRPLKEAVTDYLNNYLLKEERW